MPGDHGHSGQPGGAQHARGGLRVRIRNIIYNIHDIYNIYNIYNVSRSGHPLSYASWMGWAVPLMLVNTGLAWLLLCTVLRPVRNTLQAGAR